eukprot:1306823-Amphidinium_carterae.1
MLDDAGTAQGRTTDAETLGSESLPSDRRSSTNSSSVTPWEEAWVHTSQWDTVLQASSSATWDLGAVRGFPQNASKGAKLMRIPSALEW